MKYINEGYVYDGQFKNGLKHGKGVVTWQNGDRLIGEWQNDNSRVSNILQG